MSGPVIPCRWYDCAADICRLTSPVKSLMRSSVTSAGWVLPR